jgi:uncharacterized protein (DUF58 family)
LSLRLRNKDVQHFSKLELFAKQVVEGFITGLHKSPFHGFSVEFAEHRIYNNGESTRHIDWKLFARSEKLFIKRYEEETNLRCHLVVDISPSMYFPYSDSANWDNNKLAFSIYSCAALMELLRMQRDAIGLASFSEGLDFYVDPKLSPMHMQMVYSQLEKYLENKKIEAPKTTSSIADTLHKLADIAHKRSLIVIFSDMFEDTDSEKIFSALQHFRHNKHEVILFHVVDKKKEFDFDFENRPYRFVDIETKKEIKLHPHELKQSYQAKMKAYKDELKLRCGQYQIDFIEADIAEGFHQVLLNYLIKRKKMMV